LVIVTTAQNVAPPSQVLAAPTETHPDLAVLLDCFECIAVKLHLNEGAGARTHLGLLRIGW
jgi:hypothetical protein